MVLSLIHISIGFSYVFQLQIHAFSPFHLAGHKKAWPVFPEERGLCLCVPVFNRLPFKKQVCVYMFGAASLWASSMGKFLSLIKH